MISERRWEDWGVLLVGLLLLLSPVLFATTLGAVEAWAAYVLGALIVLVGAASLTFERFKIGGAIQIGLAVLVFFSPWLLGFAAVTGMAVTAWVLAVGLVLLIGGEFVTGEGRQIPQVG